jgi:peptidoglycan/LPS O-acetylase OafA/YrhL
VEESNGKPIGRDNCFDLMRLILATLVLYGHGYLIGGFGDSAFYQFTRQQMGAGTLAVLGFFGISGMLVTASFERSTGFWDFFKKRIFRIFPAFWVCILVTAFFFAPFVHYLRGNSLAEFPVFGEASAFSFVYNNFLLQIRQWSVGGVLDGAPYVESLNGSLWSLYAEFRCYVGTFLLGILGCTKKTRVLLVFLFAYLYFIYVLALCDIETAKQVGPMLFVLDGHRGVYLGYLTGIILYAYREAVPWGFATTVFSGGVIGLTLLNGGFLIAAPFIVPLFMLSFGTLFTFKLKNDYSYGIYIYGFVVQQALACFPFARWNVYIFLLLSVFVSVLFGIASWHLIEKPALRFVRKSTG